MLRRVSHGAATPPPPPPRQEGTARSTRLWVGFWSGGWPPRGLPGARAVPLTMPRCGRCSVLPSRSRANAHARTARGDAGQPHATGTSMPTSLTAAASAAVAAARFATATRHAAAPSAAPSTAPSAAAAAAARSSASRSERSTQASTSCGATSSCASSALSSETVRMCAPDSSRAMVAASARGVLRLATAAIAAIGGHPAKGAAAAARRCRLTRRRSRAAAVHISSGGGRSTR
jgi:hypothetical protein